MQKIIFLLILLCAQRVYGQSERPKDWTLSRDLILYYFQNYPPFEASQIVQGYARGSFDYKSMYDDKELKPYLLKLTSRKEYCEYKLKMDVLDYLRIIEDKERLKSDIRSFFYGKKISKKVVDSLVQIPAIVLQYRDSVILEHKARNRKNSNFLRDFPDVYFISKFKYREVYDSIKAWSNEREKGKYFRELFEYNDPDMVKKVNELMFSLLEDKTTNEENKFLLNMLSKTSNAYKIISQVLHKRTKVEEILCTESYYYHFNLELVNNLYSEFLKYKITPFNGFFEDYDKKRESYHLDNKVFESFIWDNIPALKKVTLELANQLEKEEEYWMKDMPFYRKR